MKIRRAAILLLFLPLTGAAERRNTDPAAAVRAVVAVRDSGASARKGSAPEPETLRSDFDRAMNTIVADLPGLVVTSKARTAADQQRLRAQGYRPHRHSQHRLGLAWDLAGGAEVLRIAEERARLRGFVPIPMRSPVTGRVYLHVQRFARSPNRTEAGVQIAALAEPAPASPGPLDPSEGASDAIGTARVQEEKVAAEAPVSAPRPLGAAGFEFPRRLLAKRVRGTIVLLLEINEAGRVDDLKVDRSDLPDFDSFVADTVKRWKFTPAVREGLPVSATARLPIPIRIQ